MMHKASDTIHCGIYTLAYSKMTLQTCHKILAMSV